jgi:hypothetical protein
MSVRETAEELSKKLVVAVQGLHPHVDLRVRILRILKDDLYPLSNEAERRGYLSAIMELEKARGLYASPEMKDHLNFALHHLKTEWKPGHFSL